MARLGRSYVPVGNRRYDRPPKYAALPRVVDVEITFTQTETLATTLTVARSLTVTFTQTETVTVTLDVTRGPYLKFTRLVPSFSIRHVRNVVTVTRQGGVAITAIDRTSIGTYRVRSYELSTLASTDADSATTAARLLTRYAQPSQRYSSMTVTPDPDPANLFPQVLGRQIGDRVTVVRTPQDVGQAVVKEVIVEGISHTLDESSWTTDFALSPAQWTG